MKVDKNKLKVTGMVAAVIAVVGSIVIIGSSSITSELTKGVSADLGDLVSGSVTVMSTEAYDVVLAKLNDYFAKEGDKPVQDNIVREVVNILEEVHK